MACAGYIPNEHHRVVAHASLSSGGNLAPLSEETLSRHHFGCQMLSAEQYTDCQNDQFSHENRSKGMPCMSQMPFCSNGNKFHNDIIPLSRADIDNRYIL